jgi:hypothetical protein
MNWSLLYCPLLSGTSRYRLTDGVVRQRDNLRPTDVAGSFHYLDPPLSYWGSVTFETVNRPPADVALPAWLCRDDDDRELRREALHVAVKVSAVWPGAIFIDWRTFEAIGWSYPPWLLPGAVDPYRHGGPSWQNAEDREITLEELLRWLPDPTEKMGERTRFDSEGKIL